MTEKQVVKLKHGDVVRMMVWLKWNNAKRWNNERLAEKLQQVKEVMPDDKEPEDEAVAETLHAVVTAIEEGCDFEIVGEKDDKQSDAKAKKAEKAEKSDGETVNAESSNSAEESKSDQKPKKRGPKGPGVIKTIAELVSNATPENPVSKAQILDELCSRFPDRQRESMEKTINVQVPNRLRKEKGLNIQKNDDGYFTTD